MKTLLDLRIQDDKICFIPQDPTVGKSGITDYTPELWDLLSSTKWRIKKNDGKPKYIYSHSLKRSLHHFVLDYYWGNGASRAAIDKGMIVEHLNNNGFDCRIQNLFVLKKVKNTNKGFYLDPLVQEMIRIVSLQIYHVIENKTFQIVLSFNKSYINQETDARLDALKLLYPYTYDIVLQDAETILEYFENNSSFTLAEMVKPLRCKGVRTRELHIPEGFFTEEERALPPGSILEKNGEIYIVPGMTGDKATFILSSPYDKGWDL